MSGGHCVAATISAEAGDCFFSQATSECVRPRTCYPVLAVAMPVSDHEMQNDRKEAYLYVHVKILIQDESQGDQRHVHVHVRVRNETHDKNQGHQRPVRFHARVKNLVHDWSQGDLKQMHFHVLLKIERLGGTASGGSAVGFDAKGCPLSFAVVHLLGEVKQAHCCGDFRDVMPCRL